jgi:hypothetical protein
MSKKRKTPFIETLEALHSSLELAHAIMDRTDVAESLLLKASGLFLLKRKAMISEKDFQEAAAEWDRNYRSFQSLED